MWDIVYYLLMLVLVAASIVAGGILLRSYQSGNLAALSPFAPRPEPRIDVVEQSNVDGRRRLLLVRRDDVEHLIMTGGPVDVVIETGISTRPQRSAEIVEAQAFVRSRAVGQTGSD